MKRFTEFIIEGRAVDSILIKDTNNKNVDVVYSCYDKDSLDEVIKKYEAVGKYWQGKGFFLATMKNKSTWIVDKSKEYKVNSWQPNGEFLKWEDETDYDETYTKQELLDAFEKGDTMLIVINK